MKKFLYLILIFSFQTYGQEIKGYLYDSEGRVPNFEIWNVTQNLNTGSDSNGYFEIPAVVGDTLVFNSVAYNKYKFTVEKKHFENDIVVELSYNSLDEVIINSYNRKPINIENLDSELSIQIGKDIINNPTLYEPSKGNIRYLFQNIIGLFKNNNKAKEHKTDERKLVAKDFKLLFESDNVLNRNFLLNELQIPIEYHNLFMEYLGSKNFSVTYLAEKKRLDLIDAVYESGKEYNVIMNSSINEDH